MPNPVPKPLKKSKIKKNPSKTHQMNEILSNFRPFKSVLDNDSIVLELNLPREIDLEIQKQANCLNISKSAVATSLIIEAIYTRKYDN